MKRNLGFLSKALSTAALRRTLRQSLEKLHDMLWSEVLVRNKFTASGAAQLVRDLGAIVSLIEQYVHNGSAALEGLQEGAKLLSLPLESPPQEEQRVGGGGGDGLSLKQATDRVFTDNAEAKKVLEELDIRTLSPAHARTILQRRVENSE